MVLWVSPEISILVHRHSNKTHAYHKAEIMPAASSLMTVSVMDVRPMGVGMGFGAVGVRVAVILGGGIVVPVVMVEIAVTVRMGVRDRLVDV